VLVRVGRLQVYYGLDLSSTSRGTLFYAVKSVSGTTLFTCTFVCRRNTSQVCTTPRVAWVFTVSFLVLCRAGLAPFHDLTQAGGLVTVHAQAAIFIRPTFLKKMGNVMMLS